jgi:adenylate cyclase
MARASKHSATERERKFLVRKLPANLSRFKHDDIEQGYLAIPRSNRLATEVRIRRTGAEYMLTVKQGSGESRDETEAPIPAASARHLWPLTAGARVRKVRYKIPYEGLKIELDVYRGRLRGLAVAEVEFPSAAAMKKFKPPKWFGREVTGSDAYSNSSLATSGEKPKTRRRT